MIVAFKCLKNSFLQHNLCIFKDVMHTGLNFCNNKLIKHVLLLTIFMSTLSFFPLVCISFHDQDDSALDSYPQTMGLVRIKGFLLYYFFKCEKYYVFY